MLEELAQWKLPLRSTLKVNTWNYCSDILLQEDIVHELTLRICKVLIAINVPAIILIGYTEFMIVLTKC